MTIFITPSDENDDADEDSAGEEDTNPGIVHFSRNILEARDRGRMEEADNDTLNKKQNHKKKKQYKWRKGDL